MGSQKQQAIDFALFLKENWEQCPNGEFCFDRHELDKVYNKFKLQMLGREEGHYYPMNLYKAKKNWQRDGLLFMDTEGDYVFMANRLKINKYQRTAARNPPKRPSRKTSESKRKVQGRIAVDQHLTIPGGVEAVLDTMNSVSSPEALPAGVKLVGLHRLWCQICGASISSQACLDQHMAGRKHKVNCLVYAMNRKKDELVSDKCGLCVLSDGNNLPEGRIHVEVLERREHRITISISNNSDDAMVFKRCEMMKKLRVFRLDDHRGVTDINKSIILVSGDTYEVMLTVEARHVGQFSVPLVFMFSPELEPERNIHIVRYVSARCTNEIVTQLGPTAPYEPPPRVAQRTPMLAVIDGLPLPDEKKSDLEKKVEIEPYRVPDQLRAALNRGLDEKKAVSEDRRDYCIAAKNLLTEPVSRSTECRKFQMLLHIEEIQMEVDIRKYDMKGVTMAICRENRRLLTLKVPGLAENRPSVLKGDCLFVQILDSGGEAESKEYKGYVHRVTLNEVWLGFSSKLMDMFIQNMQFNVRFTFNRLPLRLQHRAVQLAEEHSLEKILHPTYQTAASWGTIQPLDAPLHLYDSCLERNKKQQEAVAHIVSGTSRPGPYLLFGPPGTGKTVTMVESMKQVIRCIPGSHILACAPSNSAADLVTQRLLKHLSKSQVYRMNAMSRPLETIPQDILAVCNIGPNGTYVFPSKEKLKPYGVIVCTMVTAGRLASANFPAGYFTHVFLDESGHAVEPEALIAIAGILESDRNIKDGCQVVLAGDPEQLGPVLRSPVAIKHGLGCSLLERLMKMCDVYQKTPPPDDCDEGMATYDPNVLTKLVQNYRSHPAILELPNQMFYDGDLEPHADKLVRESLCQWDGLPKRGFPVMFHGVFGEDMREERSPSFFNPEEACTVLTYVDQLLAARGMGIKVKETDIGIISPYRKQVQKIQKALSKKNLNKIKVGSVEEFQGQESRVIIISTVRSNLKHLPMDSDFKLGFLKNPKRFNVAITRAKALLIVVGNPNILARDPHWNRFLQYCRANDSCCGGDFDDAEDELEDIMQRFQAVNLDSDGIQESTGGASHITEVEEPAWRNENP